LKDTKILYVSGGNIFYLLQELKRKKILDTIKDFDDYLVFADLLGGTPCNVVSRLIMEGKEIELYAGMNLPMVIEFINSSLIGADSNYQEKAAESIVKVNDLLAGLADDDEDE